VPPTSAPVDRSAINKYDYFEGVFPSTAVSPPNTPPPYAVIFFSSPAQSSSFSSLFLVSVAQPTCLAGENRYFYSHLSSGGLETSTKNRLEPPVIIAFVVVIDGQQKPKTETQVLWAGRNMACLWPV